MNRTDAPGAVLALAVVIVAFAATAAAGLDGRAVPATSWVLWSMAALAAVGGFAAARVTLLDALRRLAWLAPLVAMFALPAALLAPSGHRAALLLARSARAFAAAAVAAALGAWLGPAGLVDAARQLRVPAPLVDVLAAMLSGLVGVTRQVQAMLRAREARRPGAGAWPRLLADPREAVRGFGRLVAALLLRSLERGEALERARRARGGVE